MNTSKLTKGFYSEDCAIECEKQIKEDLKGEPSQIVRKLDREGSWLHIEFFPDTDASDADAISFFMDGYEAGYKKAHHSFY